MSRTVPAFMDIITKKAIKLKGTIKAPASKSYTHRAIMAWGMDGHCRIENPLICDDTNATIGLWRKLGAHIKSGHSYLNIKGVDGQPKPKVKLFNAGESGTLLRLILPVLVLAKGRLVVTGRGTLLKRSNRPIAQALRSLGLDIKGRGVQEYLPISIFGTGAIRGGKIRVSAAMSSQTVSALLLACCFAKKDTTIIIKDKLVSRPYVDVTIDVLRRAGIRIINHGYKSFFIKSGQQFRSCRKYIIGGDYSSAAFLMAAGILIESDIRITGLKDDAQGDCRVIKILNSFGARIRREKNEVLIKGPFKLKGINIDCSDTPDLVPILAVVGCFAQGVTKIYNIAHLAHKESNRIIAPAEQLRKLGADIRVGRDSLTIIGNILKPARVSSCGDHRMAMALTVAGLAIGGVQIAGAECVSKSYPDFFKDLKSLKAKFA